MLDINYLTEHRTEAEARLAKKGFNIDLSPLIELNVTRKKITYEVEVLKAEVNKLSSSVPQVKKAGGDIKTIFEEVKQINLKIADLEKNLKAIEDRFNDEMAVLPNLPDVDLKAGGKENNEVVEVIGVKPTFNFKFKDHVELATSLGLIDYSRAAKISGTGTWIYTGLGARLEWALLNYFIDEHLKDNYEFILPPHLLNEESGFTAGQFPKFKEDVFYLEGSDPKKFLLPTAETALVNYHRNEILGESELPKKYFAYTPCYRKEAGSYRSEERGMIRGYQFNKVEIFQYTTPKQSDKAFNEMVRKVKRLVSQLGLHFQISKLAAGDCSHAMAKTYDVEVYLPSINIYKEISSASNARDYQARRGKIRYRDKKSGKTVFVHTLNASGLATSRLFPAILEQFQQEDGSVIIPRKLRPYLSGLKVLKPLKKATT